MGSYIRSSSSRSVPPRVPDTRSQLRRSQGRAGGTAAVQGAASRTRGAATAEGSRASGRSGPERGGVAAGALRGGEWRLRRGGRAAAPQAKGQSLAVGAPRELRRSRRGRRAVPAAVGIAARTAQSALGTAVRAERRLPTQASSPRGTEGTRSRRGRPTGPRQPVVAAPTLAPRARGQKAPAGAGRGTRAVGTLERTAGVRAGQATDGPSAVAAGTGTGAPGVHASATESAARQRTSTSASRRCSSGWTVGAAAADG